MASITAISNSDVLITDSNILVRCVVGRAMAHVDRVQAHQLTLATTAHSLEEVIKVLTTRLGYSLTFVERGVTRLTARFQVVPPPLYTPHRPAAERRLRVGGQADWHVLAAALALGGDIWSEDLDFFGVGVPVWTTANVVLRRPPGEQEQEGDGRAI